MEGREEGAAGTVVELKKRMTLEELCRQREREPSPPPSRLVDDEDDTYKILSPRYKPSRKHKKKKKSSNSNSKNSENKKKEEGEEEGEEKLSSKKDSADEKFTSRAAAQTTHADVVAETAESPRPLTHETHSLPTDAVAEQAEATGERKLVRWHTLRLSRPKVERNAVKEGDLVWVQSRKDIQRVGLSLSPTLLWIRKAGKDYFSPFIEIANISNVYMKKDPTMVIPPSPLGEAKEKEKEQQEKEQKEKEEKKQKAKEEKARTDSGASNETRRRKSFSDVPEPEELEGEVEETKRPARPGSRIGSAIKRGTSMSLRRTPSPSSLQAVAHHSFVVEVRRKEFTTNIVTHVFALEDKSEVEAWVTALHEVIIASRREKRKSLLEERAQALAERNDDDKGKEKEKGSGGSGSSGGRKLSPRKSGATSPAGAEELPELTYQADLLTGLSSVIPGETEKQRARRLKQEVRDELQERKRRGKAEAKLTLFGLVTTKGYPIEEHKVTTPDGYIVTLHRIPHSKSETGYSARPAVFLMHGLMDCSVTWIISESHKALGFIFADNGFDVWMGNSRGNRFSREHAQFKVDSTQYWNFNRDDLVKDVRSSIDYVLNYTDQKHLVYVGHSQGTNVMFAMLATQPDVRSKISIGLALAPATYVHNQKSKMMTYLANMQTDKIFQFMGIKAFLTTGTWLNNITPGLLLYSAQGTRLVTRLIFDNMCGWNPDNNFSLDRMPVIAAHQPGGTSVMVMAHWAQSIRNGTFSHFDYGAKKNMEVYGQEVPPPYDLGSIHDARVAVFYGGEDKLTTKVDVERLLSELPEEIVDFVQYEEEYGHLDFVWGDDAHIRVYPKLVELAKKHYKLAEERRRKQELQQKCDEMGKTTREGGESDKEDKDDARGGGSSPSPSSSRSSYDRQPQEDKENGKKDDKGEDRSKKERKKGKKTKKAKSQVDRELIVLSHADLATPEAVQDVELPVVETALAEA